MPIIGGVFDARDFKPSFRMKIRKSDVSRDGGVYERQFQSIGLRQRLSIDLRATNHAQLRILGAFFHCQCQGGDALHACRERLRTSREHQIAPSRQWTANRLESPAAHQDRPPHGQQLEAS